MKKKLQKELEKTDRNLKWFWRLRIKNMCSYAHYMNQLNGDTPFQEDVEKAINTFLEEK